VNCTYCKKGIDPADLDVRIDGYKLEYHAACWKRFDEIMAAADRVLVLNANVAHDRGGYCPLCRAVREAGSLCWDV